MEGYRYYLAIDIGASGGRHILAHRENEKLCLEEIYRFENRMVRKNGHLCWEMDRLFAEIKAGMARCKAENKIPKSVGIDSWAVDFVLLDEGGKVLGDTVGYRDERTDGMIEAVGNIIPESALYARTGIQQQKFNTIYQLMAIKKEHPEYLKRAQAMLMIPDYFHYLLSGNQSAEYTNASTTQLMDAGKKDWDRELIEMLGFPQRIFQTLSRPGTFVGMLTDEIQKEVGFQCRVVAPATHDTASAVMASPFSGEGAIYISSGTWSLMGIEREQPENSEKSRRYNFTNEGGYDYKYRFLKNIMGLWMIQNVKKELQNKYSFAQLCDMAEQTDFHALVDVDDGCFMAPDSMTEAIQDWCATHGQPVPQTPGELAKCIYESLAHSYARTVEEIEDATGSKYEAINIVGGGANADYLNKLTACISGREVLAGPTEATATGNIAAQMIAAGEFSSLSQARDTIKRSFTIKEYGKGIKK